MSRNREIRKRKTPFNQVLETQITEEVPCQDNPYLYQEMHICGYDHLQLIAKVSFTDMLFLMLKQQLPTPQQSRLLQALSVAFCNPGLRHEASQAAITSAAGRTEPLHILPIAMGMYSGQFNAAGEITEIHQHFAQLRNVPAEEWLNAVKQGQIPGFGTLYGSKDPYALKLLEALAGISETDSMVYQLAQLEPQLNDTAVGILKTGVATAALTDLSFDARQSSVVFQWMAAPGLLAHGLEYCDKPMSAMRFESDEQYQMEFDND